MKTLHPLVTLALSALSVTAPASPVLAGGNVGNGGDAFVCQDGIYLLDYREAPRFGISLQNPVPGGSVRQIVEKILDQWSQVESRSELYRPILEEMLSAEENRKGGTERVGATLYSPDPLNDVPDSKEVSTPVGCKKEQLVVQERPVLPTDLTYQIRVDLWDQMDNYQKALTFMHEAFVREAVTLGHPDTRMARRMNIAIAAGAYMETVCRYVEFVSRVDFRTIRYDGLTVLPDRATCHSDGYLAQGHLAGPQPLAIPNVSAKLYTDNVATFSPGRMAWTKTQLYTLPNAPDLIDPSGNAVPWQNPPQDKIAYKVRYRTLDKTIDGDLIITGAEKLRMHSTRRVRKRPKQSIGYRGKLPTSVGSVTLRIDGKTGAITEI